MYEPKWTKGPWEVSHRQGADGMYRTEVFSAAHGGIATCDWTVKNCGNGVIGTYREANAHLIAAAPCMYDELRHMTEAYAATYGDDCPAVTRARAALAKAEGRDHG